MEMEASNGLQHHTRVSFFLGCRQQSLLYLRLGSYSSLFDFSFPYVFQNIVSKINGNKSN